jgi:hypothetical protein
LIGSEWGGYIGDAHNIHARRGLTIINTGWYEHIIW